MQLEDDFWLDIRTMFSDLWICVGGSPLFTEGKNRSVCQCCTFTPSAETATVAFESLSTERSYKPQTNARLFIPGLERNMKCRSTSWNAYRAQCVSNFRVFSTEYKLEESQPSGLIKKNNHTEKTWVLWKNCSWEVYTASLWSGHCLLGEVI